MYRFVPVVVYIHALSAELKPPVSEHRATAMSPGKEKPPPEPKNARLLVYLFFFFGGGGVRA